MFTFGGDDDFDFAEDFLQDAFELNKKDSSTNSRAPDAERSIDCGTPKSNGNHVTKLRKIPEQRKENLQDIESLLEDDWDLDDRFLSSIHEDGTLQPQSDENSPREHHIVSSTIIRKDSLPVPKTTAISNASGPTLHAGNHTYVTTPIRHNELHTPTTSTNSLNRITGRISDENVSAKQPASVLRTANCVSVGNALHRPTTSTNSLNCIRGLAVQTISSANNRRSNQNVLEKEIGQPELRAANGVSYGEMSFIVERGMFRNGEVAAHSEGSPINPLPKRTNQALGLDHRYGNISSPGISPGYSSRAKRKFPGPAGILPQLPADGKVPKTMSPVPNQRSSSIVRKDQSVPQCASSSSQSSQCPFEGEAWQRMKRDLDIDDSDPNSMLARFNIAWVLFKARAKELPKKKAPILVAVLKAIALEGRRAKVVLQDETGEIIGTIHEKVLEEYASSLQLGTVLVLRQVSIFSPTSFKHYLNVTPSNIVALYGANGTTVGVQDVSGPHLMAAAEEMLLEANMIVTNSSTSRQANWSGSSPTGSPSLWGNSPASRPALVEPISGAKPFLFQPVTTIWEDSLWNEDDLDTLLQGIDDNDLCG